MNDKNYTILLNQANIKVEKSFLLVKASLKRNDKYKVDYDYSYDELEPYDALTDRFIRCIEMFIKYFKTYDAYMSINKSLTYRDLINRMEKLELVSQTPIWMDMRDIRNKVVHDYLSETKKMFDSMMTEFFDELKFSKNKIDVIGKIK